ncbi:hypothetical protein QJS10_CPA16g00545 [Acorus calamus]|uniref:Uncharacterized protein n=1 Tax=Acorus calamus TaxID=4465 RepID=A0AAV9D1M0_ACOCL|nr:hypothetical protein QJS10_CPA16g00545 [Acorus calamus]
MSRPSVWAAAVLIMTMVVGLWGEAEGISSGPHINDLNVLLPPRMTHPVEYRLRGTDGCFTWNRAICAGVEGYWL